MNFGWAPQAGEDQTSCLRRGLLAQVGRAGKNGLGRQLLRFCMELAEKTAEELGCVGLVVDAKPDAVEFYRRLGFSELDLVDGASPQRPQPLAMFLPLGSIPRR